MSLSERPMKLLESEFKRMNKEDALHTNIVAASLMAELIRTSFGPFGLDKMIIDPLGDIIITNDGSTIVKNFDVRHPVARILDNLVRSQDYEAGDGTKTAVILTGELLKQAFHLLENKIHPNDIISGYEIALKWVNELLDKNAIKVDINDKQILRNLVLTALNSKFQVDNEEYLADLVVDAVMTVLEKDHKGDHFVNLKNIFVLAIKGGNIRDSRLVRGMVIDKEILSGLMPKRIENAKIAMVEPSLEPKKVHEFKPKISIIRPDQMKIFRNEDLNILKKFINKMKETGVNVAFFRRDISEKAQSFLNQAGIIAARFVHRDQFYATQKAIGANLITKLDDYSEKDLGHAKLVEERKVGKKKVIFIEDCKNPKAVCILLRAGIKNVGYELERRIMDALSVVKNAVEEKKILAGGGAIEIELSRKIKFKSNTMHGKKQLAINAFADSLEIIPKTLIETAGLDIIDMLANLRAAHNLQNDDSRFIGLNTNTFSLDNMIKAGIIDSYRA
ncbi:MAG: thermosome subunit beta, partial [Candidatus Helarchaeota archaeon]